MSTVYINNIKYNVDLAGEDKGITIFQFCLNNNITIPCFCYHDKLSVAGNCRICVVDVLLKAGLTGYRKESKKLYARNNNTVDMYDRIVIDPKRRLMEDFTEKGDVDLVDDSKNLEELVDARKTQRQLDNKWSKIKFVRKRRLSVIISCAITLKDHMMIFTDSKRIKKMRESIVEFLLANHPLDCPICDQGGECDLQDLTLLYGKERTRHYNYNKRSVVDINFASPFIKTIMDRCIHCTRCVRFVKEISGNFGLGVIGRGVHMQIGTYIKRNIDDFLISNVIDLCPVGALCAKSSSYSDRSWEYKSYYGFDIFDSVCSSLRFDVVGDKIIRVVPFLDENVNEEWITNKARFCFDALNVQRITYPQLKIYAKLITVSWAMAISIFIYILYLYREFSIKGFLGNFIDLGSMFIYKSLFKSIGLSNIYFIEGVGNLFIDTRLSFLLNYTIASLGKINNAFMVSTNLRLEAPLINSRFLKNYLYNRRFKAYSIGLSNNYSGYPIKNLGVSLMTFVKILMGKLYVLYDMMYSDYLNLYILNYTGFSLYKDINFLLGSSVLQRTDSNSILGSLFQLLANLKIKLSNINIVYKLSGKIMYDELGICNKKNKINKKKKTFSYFCGVDIESLGIKLLDNNNFNIYQGSFNILSLWKINYFNLILPVSFYIENSLVFLNVEGRLRKSNGIVNKSKLFSDAEIFKIIYLEKSKKIINNFTNITNFNYQIAISFVNYINYACTFFYNLKMLKSIELTDNIITISNLYNYKILNTILNKVVVNYYKTDVFVNNSKTLSLASSKIKLKTFSRFVGLTSGGLRKEIYYL